MSTKTLFLVFLSLSIFGCSKHEPDKSTTVEPKPNNRNAVLTATADGSCATLETIKTSHNDLFKKINSAQNNQPEHKTAKLCDSLAYLAKKNILAKLDARKNDITDFASLNLAIRQLVLAENPKIKLEDVELGMMAASFYDDTQEDNQQPGDQNQGNQNQGNTNQGNQNQGDKEPGDKEPEKQDPVDTDQEDKDQEDEAKDQDDKDQENAEPEKDEDDPDPVDKPRSGRIFVTQNGTADSNGNNWGDALAGTDLQAVIDSMTGGEIWLAKGVYKPKDKGGFHINKGIKLYGGFSGTENKLTDRQQNGANKTILSGDIDNNDNNASGITTSTNDIQGSNATTILTINNTTNDENIIDGLIFTAGKTNSKDAAAGVDVKNSPSLKIYNSAFYGNENSYAATGAPTQKQGYGAAALKLHNIKAVHIKDSEFKGNTGYEGVALNIFSADNDTNKFPVITIENSKFSNNNAQSNAKGGAILSRNNKLSISNSEFTANTIPMDGGMGGAIYSGSDILILDKVSFANNFTGYNGGAINIDFAQKVSIKDSVFDNNAAKQFGGALYLSADYNANKTTKFQNVRFYGNSSGKQGGALYFEGGEQTINQATFYGNSTNSTMTSKGGGQHKSASEGGAVYLAGTYTTKISNATFAYNSSFANWDTLNGNNSGQGSAIYNGLNPAKPTNKSKLTLNYTTFYRNKANYINNDTQGVAVFTHKDNNTAKIYNSLFVSNQPIGNKHDNQYFPKYSQANDLAGRELAASKDMIETTLSINNVEQIAYLQQSNNVNAVTEDANQISQPQYDQTRKTRTAGNLNIGAVEQLSTAAATPEKLYITQITPWEVAAGGQIDKTTTITLSFDNQAGDLNIVSLSPNDIKSSIELSNPDIDVNVSKVDEKAIKFKLINMPSALTVLTIKADILGTKGALNHDYIYRFGVK